MPIKPKKFGAFAGVFTPSILTILGVIMYLRLGWVVGQAGLISAIIIIVLAHVISVSTGLSISSIATDKKIKAGGIYYMLSRSLGLPMGGAIGIALFTGTALSISLYLIGFAESVLSIEPIRNFLGLSQDINGFRIIGTIAMVLLVAIAFISTSLALKTQYYVLGAIVLSLISIITGFFFNTELAPAEVIREPLKDGIPLEIVFAVFFPAVTGFTAGVAMSGDLKDPKKAIPRGTLMAILIGFIVYLGLAISFAFFINRDILVNDTNFLLRIAWLPALVIAGIWGATLSSAMGGILGGPRILQAISSDKITPKIFAKGYGANNEPRNALIFIFLIAEAGILIGELNIIAGIVSMFYLASYGFINIAYYLESWASTDFRPTFKINRYVGLIGFIASFGVMFQLDMLSMFAALIIMIGLYFLLKRKQLKLEYGDVWHSVWSSIMRTALEKMDNTDLDERNWQPNIILFSGGTNKRPHLIELGKSLVGRHGVLSNFDLVENKKARVLFPKNKQSLPGEISEKGFFARRQTVKDIFEGIETISRTYGFSGIEPNTVMMGWARQTKKPKRFAELLNSLNDLDFNILLLDYHKETGFGNYNSIDIWWADESNHGNLAVTLTKLLILSRQWQNATVRILIVNSQNKHSDSIINKAENILENMRIDATVKVINNQIEQKPLYDIVYTESVKTDLVFLGIPDIEGNEEALYIENTNRLLKNIGTVMLIKASSNFKDLKLGMESAKPKYLESSPEISKPILHKTSRVNLPEKPEIESELNALLDSLNTLIDNNYNNFFIPILQNRANKAHTVGGAIKKSIVVFESKYKNLDKNGQIILLHQLKSGLLNKLEKVIQEHRDLTETEKTDFLKKGINEFISDLSDITDNVPDQVTILLGKDDLQKNDSDPIAVKWFKWNQRTFHQKKLNNKGVPYELDFRKAVQVTMPISQVKNLNNFLEDFGKFNIQFIFEYQKLLYTISDGFLFLEKSAGTDELENILSEIKENTSAQIKDFNHLIKTTSENASVGLKEDSNAIINDLGKQLSKIRANAYLSNFNPRQYNEKTKALLKIPEDWAFNQSTLFNLVQILSSNLLMEFRLKNEVDIGLSELNKLINNELSKKASSLNSYLNKFIQELKENTSPNFNPPKSAYNFDEQLIHLSLSKISDKLFRNTKSFLQALPESIELFSEETANEITNIQYTERETINIPISRLADEYIQSGFIEPLMNLIREFESELTNSLIKIKDSIRLIRLSYQMNETTEASEDFILAGDVLTFVTEQKQKIANHVKSVENRKLETFQKIEGNLDQALNEFSVYRLLKPQDLKSQTRKNKESKSVRAFKMKLHSLSRSYQKQKANLWHSQSEAKLYAKKLLESEDKNATIVNRLLNFKEIVSPNEKVLKELPFYYQQLFLSKYNFQSEFWYGREDALKEAKKAFDRYNKGYKGAIVITGERRSGKSFFVNYFVSEVFKGKNKYTVYPPLEGSINPEVFIKTINETLKIKGSLDTVFSNLPGNSIIIFDDLELWWEKSENGLAVINLLSDLIKRYSQKYIFILAANQESYTVINDLSQLNSLSINTIRLTPFSSKEIQELILYRHQTSDLDLKLFEGANRGVTLSKQARFFLKVFQISGGNVGASLLSWIASIYDFKNGTIYIESPRSVSLSVFDELKPDIKLYLTLLILHKRMSIDKFKRITLDDEISIVENIQFLKRSGVINELADNIFEIDRFMVHPVKNYLFDKTIDSESI